MSDTSLPVHRFYKIIITKNKKEYRVINEWGLYRSYEYAVAIYNGMLETNKHVLFPKINVCSSRICKPIIYELLLLKSRRYMDRNRFVRNDIGKIVEEKLTSNDWTVEKSHIFYFEEEFTIFGEGDKNDKLDTKKIIEHILLKDITKKDISKQCILFNYFVIIKTDNDNNDYKVVRCKNKDESKKMFNILRDSCLNIKPRIINNIIFIRANTKEQRREIGEWLNDKGINTNYKYK